MTSTKHHHKQKTTQPTSTTAIQQEMEHYKTELTRAQEFQRQLENRQKLRQVESLKAELQNAEKSQSRSKRQKLQLQKNNEKLQKKLNEMQDKIMKSQKQIKGLRTIRNSQQYTQRNEKTQPSVPNPETKKPKKSSSPKHPESLHFAEENKILRQRLEMYERASRSNESTFEPILREHTDQIRQLLVEKTQLIGQNAMLKDQLQQSESSSQHYQKKYQTIEIAFHKLKSQYQRLSIALINQSPHHSPIKRVEQDHEAEERIRELELQLQNQRQHIRHLESTNRYLVTENKKLQAHFN